MFVYVCNLLNDLRVSTLKPNWFGRRLCWATRVILCAILEGSISKTSCSFVFASDVPLCCTNDLPPNHTCKSSDLLAFGRRIELLHSITWVVVCRWQWGMYVYRTQSVYLTRMQFDRFVLYLAVCKSRSDYMKAITHVYLSIVHRQISYSLLMLGLIRSTSISALRWFVDAKLLRIDKSFIQSLYYAYRVIYKLKITLIGVCSLNTCVVYKQSAA